MTGGPGVRVLVVLVLVYRRVLSPLKPPTCRYVPTCSQYAIAALERHGVARGGWLATKRICRCHPWGGHGWDPVPGTAQAATSESERPIAQDTVVNT
jgi:putative membrane protein insertion efficiency factor